MTNAHTEVAVLGECMLELSPVDADCYQLSAAGDTFNTAVGLSQLGIKVEYLTALGSDNYSELITARAEAYGVGLNYLIQDDSRTPGLYLINTDAKGERQFTYWRENSAARALLSDGSRLHELLTALEPIPYFYLSGITLALCAAQGRSTLFQWLSGYRSRGGKLVYDSNYRAALWPNTDEAIEAHTQCLALTDIYLPSAEDLMILGNPESQLAPTYSECTKTQGEGDIELSWTGGEEFITPEKVDKVVDTSGAGDSFKAGYLAARLRGTEPAAAARFGAKCGAEAVQSLGAILPAERWQALKQQLD